jgi:hypothetical protein
LRRRLFPPERNLIPAHLTLFHALPGAEMERVLADLRRACARQAPALRVGAPRSLGRGVAYAIESAELVALRAELARAWSAWLTPQDRQGFRPHVVVQNKVDPETARRTLTELTAAVEVWSVRTTAVHVWRYLGGPWSSLARVPFG